jgi:hypothetical protein
LSLVDLSYVSRQALLYVNTSSSCLTKQTLPKGKKVKPHIQAESLAVGVIATLAVVVLGILAANFWKSPLAHSMEQWGQFGDYMGGVLNPLVAFAALLLLARSIALQRTELAEARRVLGDQAQSAKLSAQLTGYSSMINSALAQIEIYQSNAEYILRQLQDATRDSTIFDLDGSGMSRDVARAKVQNISGHVHDLVQEQRYFQAEMRLLLT